MSSDDETRLLKAVASLLIEPIWLSEFYNDAEDYINYNDPESKRYPRSEKEIKSILNQLKRLKNDILDELTEELKRTGYVNPDLITENSAEVRNMIDSKFSIYRRELWNVVKPSFSSK